MPLDGPSNSARESAVERGRIAFHSQRHKHAIAHFSKAINSCPCAKSQGGTREKCACKDYDAGTKTGGAYDLVDEILKPCACEAPGRIFSRCDDPVHNQALGYRAGCYEELDKLDLARRDAEWALELYPLRIEAYLRFGKVARKQGKPVLAWQIYSAGVQIGRRNGLAGDVMFKKLLEVRSGLHRKFSRLDPLGLPIETVEQIFSHFDTREICNCLRVSKQWTRTLTNRSFLWRHISFPPRARTVPGLNAVRRIVKYSGNNIRSLSILNTNKFNMEAKFPALLNGSRQMADLRLAGSPVNCGDGLSRATWPLSNLTHLTLSSHMFQDHSIPGPSDTNRLLTDILTRNANHIEFLCITSDHINFGPSWPRMEKLKYLKLVETPKATLPYTYRHRQTVGLPLLWLRAPNVEHFWLDAYQVLDRTPEVQEPPTSRFPRLKFLVVGPKVYWPCVGAPLEELAYLHRTGDAGYGSLGFGALSSQEEEVFHLDNTGDPGAEFPTDVLAKAQHVYLPRFSPDTVYDSPPKACVRAGIEAAVKAGTLRTLAMCVYMVTHHENYLDTFGWVSGCPTVRTLSLFIRPEPHNARADGLAQQGELPSRQTRARAIGEFVRTFPNLETLEVTAEDSEMTATVGIIIEVSAGEGSSIKRVYQKGIDGHPFDQLRGYLAGRSVELLYGRIPEPKFPIKSV